MVLHSTCSIKRVTQILTEQVDKPPSLLRCLISLNAARYIGNSMVCGTIESNTFELRNHRDPYFSLRAVGKLKEDNAGTDISIKWIKPRIPDLFGVLLFKRYDDDKATIVSFIEKWLNIKSNEGNGVALKGDKKKEERTNHKKLKNSF